MSATAVAVRKSFTMPRMSGSKIVFSWIGLALVAFPLAGYAGWGISGHVDGVGPALIGGAVTGAGIGFVQWMFLRRDLNMSPVWILATGIALAAGLSIGAVVVGYETTPSQVAIMGAISLWHVWMVAMPVMYAIAWLVTESFGIDVANQFTVFGASGSVVFGLLSGLLMMAGKRIDDRAAV
jgi:hypothetical protein